MALDEGQRAKLVESLSEKWPAPRRCAVCNQEAWGVSDKVFQLPEYSHPNIVVGGPIMPVFAAVCANCGNTLFFNAIHLGLVAKESKGTSDASQATAG